MDLELGKLAIDESGSARPGTVLYRAEIRRDALRRTVRHGSVSLHDVEIRLPTGAALKMHQEGGVRMGFELAPEHVELDGDIVLGSNSDGQKLVAELVGGALR